jgi:Zn finger protein HypA/HybF involved in hydrogenase expression
MKMVIEQSKLEKERFTWQGEIPLTRKCRKCKEEAILMAEIQDDEGLIKDQRPENVKIWPHDSMVIHIYLCPNCGKMKTLWNQA